jgi:hypothetical protein
MLLLRFRHTASALRSDTCGSAASSGVPPATEQRSGERAGQLIIHRPRLWSTGAGRRIRLDLDGRRIGNLSSGGTLRVPVCEGSHSLWARRPLIAARLPLDLAAHQTLRLMVYVDAFDELQIRTAGPGDA